MRCILASLKYSFRAMHWSIEGLIHTKIINKSKEIIERESIKLIYRYSYDYNSRINNKYLKSDLKIVLVSKLKIIMRIFW